MIYCHIRIWFRAFRDGLITEENPRAGAASALGASPPGEPTLCHSRKIIAAKFHDAASKT
jgi:hypothetical protein